MRNRLLKILYEDRENNRASCEDIVDRILKELMHPSDEVLKSGYDATGKWWDLKGPPEEIKREKMRIRWSAMLHTILETDEI